MSINYIAVLDYEHLDNGLFLTAFARAVAAHKHRGLILHSDSAYTDRIIQTGVMREEARKRAIKDLNHRLIALLADHGVSTIGINGYQKEMISITDNEIEIETKILKSFPEQPTLLVSTLIYSTHDKKPVCGSLTNVTIALKEALSIDDLFLFTRSEDDEILKKELPKRITDTQNSSKFIKKSVPLEFQDNLIEGKLTTATEFQKYPDVKNATILI